MCGKFPQTLQMFNFIKMSLDLFIQEYGRHALKKDNVISEYNLYITSKFKKIKKQELR